MDAKLYDLTRKIITHFEWSSKRVEAHDPDDQESVDIIYLEEVVSSDLTDGEVIMIGKGHHIHNPDCFTAEHGDAHHFGGWPTYWQSSIALPDEVMNELKVYLG